MKLLTDEQVFLMVDGQCVERTPMNTFLIKRKPGRPKTKEYRTLSVRIPKDLMDRLKAYYMHGHLSLSELVRKACDLVLKAEYPPKQQPVRSIPILASEQVRTEELQALQHMIEPQHDAQTTWQYSTVELPPNRILGKLCPRKHEYMDSGKSLLALPKRHCIACRVENERGRRARMHMIKGSLR